MVSPGATGEGFWAHLVGSAVLPLLAKIKARLTLYPVAE